MTLSLKGLNRFIEFGIDAETSAEDRRSIRLVNTLNIVTGGSAIILGPLLTKITGKPIMFPGLIEATCFAVSIFLNTRKKYFAAAMLMLLTQNIAACYFGILLGQGISIKMLAIGLAITSVFLFHTTRSRTIGLACGFIPVILLNVNDNYGFITAWTFTPDQHELIKWLADLVIFSICMIIVLTFVKQNQQASNNKNMFLRESNHEINKSLSTLITVLEKYLRKPVSGKQVTLQLEDLQAIDISARGMLDIVKHGLNFTKIEAGRFDTYNPEIFDTRRFLQEIKIAYSSLSAKKQIKIKTHLADNLPQWIKTDKNKVSLIVSNILSNAINFSYEDAIVEINVSYSENKVQFEVVDYGKGMSHARQSSIFEGLFVSEKNDLVQGWGIGMVLTRRFVEFLGGKIEVKSQEGKGTTFTVVVPVEIPDEADIAAKIGLINKKPDTTTNSSILNLSDKCALVIDDDDNMRNHAVDALNRHSCIQVYVGADGASGLAMARNILPDLIFIDVQLPDGNGLELIKRFKQLPNYKDVLFIAMSSEDSDIIRQEARKAGAALYLRKPFIPAEFRKGIQEILKVSV